MVGIGSPSSGGENTESWELGFLLYKVELKYQVIAYICSSMWDYQYR